MGSGDFDCRQLINVKVFDGLLLPFTGLRDKTGPFFFDVLQRKFDKEGNCIVPNHDGRM